MRPTKPELRETLKQARLSLPPEVRREKSAAIVGSLLKAVDWSTIRNVHCFEPIAWLGEVDLTDFVTKLNTSQPAIRVYTSRKIDGEWRIVSMETGQMVAEQKFDVIIVPMLGFDTSLHRIGYGGGHYDRFLAEQPNAQKIGVCFELGRLEQIPAESHDIPLDMIVTDTGTYLP